MHITHLSGWLYQTLMGTDIADLLLEGHEPESRAYARSSAPVSQIVDSSANASITEDRLSATSAMDVSSVELTDRFRHLLLHGRKKVDMPVSDMCTMLHPHPCMIPVIVIFLYCSVAVLEESPCPRGSLRTNLQVTVLGPYVLILGSQVIVLDLGPQSP